MVKIAQDNGIIVRCYAGLPSDPLSSSLAAVTRTSEIISVVSDILVMAMCSTLPSAGILSGLLLDVDIYHGVTDLVCISA